MFKAIRIIFRLLSMINELFCGIRKWLGERGKVVIRDNVNTLSCTVSNHINVFVIK